MGRELAGHSGAGGETVGVVLITDREQTRTRVSSALAEGGVQLVDAVCGDHAAVPATGDPDLAVLDASVEPFDAAERLATLREEGLSVPVVVLSSAVGPRAVRRMLSAGASGFVRMDDLGRALVPTIWAVAAGQVAVPADVRHQVVRPVISFREKQVLELAARGYTNGQIAQDLYLSESTVKSHLSASFRKLGVRSRAEAAALVLDPQLRVELGLGDLQLTDGLVAAI